MFTARIIGCTATCSATCDTCGSSDRCEGWQALRGGGLQRKLNKATMRWTLAILIVLTSISQGQSRPRARDLGIAPGAMEPGPLNAITDVAGVRVGQTTVVRGTTCAPASPRSCRTAATCSGRRSPAPCSSATRSASSPARRRSQELGTIESPIVLTNTLSVGTALEARRPLDARAAGQRERPLGQRAGRRNQRRRPQRHPRPARHARARARRRSPAPRPAPSTRARSAPAPARSRSAGKAASAPRRARVRRARTTYTVGVLVQTNYGGKLTIAGVPVWKELSPRPPRRSQCLGSSHQSDADGSCMIVVATDAPLDARDLERLGGARDLRDGAHRIDVLERQRRLRDRVLDASVAARDGGNAPQQKTVLPTDAVSGLFEAALDATEEAIYNSLLKAADTTGNGRTIRALPIDELRGVAEEVRTLSAASLSPGLSYVRWTRDAMRPPCVALTASRAAQPAVKSGLDPLLVRSVASVHRTISIGSSTAGGSTPRSFPPTGSPGARSPSSPNSAELDVRRIIETTGRPKRSRAPDPRSLRQHDSTKASIEALGAAPIRRRAGPHRRHRFTRGARAPDRPPLGHECRRAVRRQRRHRRHQSRGARSSPSRRAARCCPSATTTSGRDAAMQAIRDKYLAYLTHIFTLAGRPAADADVRAVLALETTTGRGAAAARRVADPRAGRTDQAAGGGCATCPASTGSEWAKPQGFDLATTDRLRAAGVLPRVRGRGHGTTRSRPGRPGSPRATSPRRPSSSRARSPTRASSSSAAC